MDMVTYKAISKIWRVLLIGGLGLGAYGLLINRSYDKLKKDYEELKHRVEVLESARGDANVEENED